MVSLVLVIKSYDIGTRIIDKDHGMVQRIALTMRPCRIF